MEVSGQLTPRCFTPRESAPDSHCIGGSVGPRAKSGSSGEEKIFKTTLYSPEQI